MKKCIFLYRQRYLSYLVLLLLLWPTVMLAAQGNIQIKGKFSLKEAIRYIEETSDYTFFYKDSDLKDKSKKEINCSGTIEEVLKNLFNGSGVNYIIKGKEVIFKVANAQNAEQQQPKKRVITGTIIDGETKEPIIGASVWLKNSSSGTVTNLDGHYSLTIEGIGGVLEFSYIGMKKQEIAISNKNVIDVILNPDTKKLDEVVVVGYGQQKKESVVVSMSSIKPKDIVVPSRSLNNSLAGQVAGLIAVQRSGEPGYDNAEFWIRGVSTFAGGTSPLVLVDGVPRSMSDIEPDEIETFSVLKDAAATAIYGAEGANGVVLVTTKKGSVQKPVLTYEVSYGWQSSTKKLDYMNAAQYQMMVNEMNKNEGKELKFPNFDINNPSTYPTTETDWQDELLNNHALVYNHKVSLSGCTDRGIYYASFGYLNQNGVVASENSYYKRYNARFNNTYTVMEDKNRFWLPKVTFGSNISYSHTESMGIGNNSDVSGVLTSMALTPPNEPIYQTDPEQLKIYDQLYAGYVKDADGRAYNIINYMREMGNPLAVRDVSNNTLNTANNFNANLNLEATLLPGLKFRTNVGLAWAFWGSRGYTPEYYITTNNRNETSSVFHKKNESYKWQVENVLSYEKTIGKHAFSVLVGQSALSEESTGLTGEDYNLLRLGMEYAYLNSAAAERSLERTDDYINQHRLSSFFARATYNYAEKYMLSLVFRRDGSSNFGPNNKYASFPSISAGWNMTEEKFMKNRPGWLNLIKLRASWGRNGNESIGAFQYTSLLNMGSNNLALGKGSKDQIYVGIVSAGYANPSIQWETSEQTDLGIDLRLLNNSLSFSVDYFDKRTKDMILWLQTPKYLGYWGMNANSGTMSNKGVEMDATYRFKAGGVNFSVNGNASYVKNEVTDRGPGFSSIATLGAGMANPNVAIVDSGMPYGYFRGYVHDGIFQNWDEVNAHVGPSGKPLQPNAKPGDIRFKNLCNDDLLDDKDLTMIGNPNPDWVYGFSLNIDWKNIDFSVFFQGVAGNQIFNYDRRANVPYANWHRKWLDRWHGEGTSNWWPRVVEDDGANQNTSRVSNLYVEDGDYLRLKVLQLGYTFPSLLTKKALISNLRIYIQCDNLLTFSKYRGYDPEVGSRSGLDSGSYPQARVFTLGASVSF